MTAEEFSNLPDNDLRHELINGELVTMSLPKVPHGRAAMRLGGPLANFVLDHDLGEFFITEVGFQLTWNPDTVLGPDLAFISKEHLKEVGEVEGFWQIPPDLAVEVLSPGDRRGKVNKKISRWLDSGTKQVWIVDPKHRTVTIYRSETDTTTFSGSDYLEAEDLFPGFRLSLDRIFGPPGIVNETK
jgi:Uma2 family endonuclease